MISTCIRTRVVLFTLMLSTVCRLYADDGVRNRTPEQIIQQVELMRSGSHTTVERGDKCGLGLSFEIVQHLQEFSESQKQYLRSLFASPSRQKSRVIGHFTILYDTTGFDAPALVTTAGSVCQQLPGTVEQYIDSLGKYFNDSWDYEINVLGYTAPPLRSDNTYLIDVHDLGSNGLYGQTFFGPSNPFDPAPYDPGPPARYKTYIEVDNDYCSSEFYYSPGLPGLQVTAAHEFHHAIQIGSYGYWGNDIYFYEITSTWMEDVVYTDVNDYYQYLFNTQSAFNASQFSDPELSFFSFDRFIQYSRAIWGKFVEKNYTRNIMLHAWEYMRQNASIPSLDHALLDAGSSFRQAFLEWAVWNSNTGLNCDTVKYYTEGRNYPTMRTRNIVQYTSPQKVIIDSIQVLSSVYRPIVVNGGQMMVIVSNVNTASSSLAKNGFSYVVADAGDESYKHLANGVYVKLEVPDPQRWSTHESVPSVVSDIVVFPNPFIARGSNVLNFRLPPVTEQSATLAIFSGALEKIISGDFSITEITASEPFISWNGHDELDRLVSSGIYFYVITVDDKKYTGKFAIIRE
jgi:hypothetical protein